ncbi:MAG: alpha-L-arabinofuranosidase [Arenicella sp.]|jgi:alpha-L-arabinofuranosidase
MKNNYIFLIFTLTATLLFSQEEPEAKFLKNKADFLDSIPLVMVNASETQRTISKYLTGSHFVYAFENDSLYKDIRIQEWMKESKKATIRWPGGTVVQYYYYYYYWDDLNGVPFKNDSWDPDYDGEKKAGYNYKDLDEYIAFCRKVNSELMVAVNIRSGKEFNMHERSLDDAKRLLTYCKEKQYNVKFWYIGNEGYAKGFSALKYPEYIDMYADVLKSVDPNIKIVGDWKMGPYKKNRFQESIDVAKASKSIDVMEFHEKWGNVWGLKSGFTMEEWRNELPIYNSKLTTLIRRFKEEMQKDNKKHQSWI